MLLICTILISCTNEKINGDNTSDSIAEVKKNNVFLQELTPQNNIINQLENYILEECVGYSNDGIIKIKNWIFVNYQTID
ncbi:hypothetical protein IW16_01410 [Chryseobacterium vrystaatense]|uniref:Uncharacterized protein n=1 Tax=Chryseobacterium vrystaatense TaxID=307480 RepID=A0ABR4URL3_9FLAO|nr:hypothetical protein IW16_01410 [Chryseobacterium vrystaatense]